MTALETLPERPSWYGLYSRIFVPSDRVAEVLTLTWPDLCWLAHCEAWTHTGQDIQCPEGSVAVRRTRGVEIDQAEEIR